MNQFTRRIAVIGHDLVMVSLAWLLAYLVRFNFSLANLNWDSYLATLPVVLAAQGLVLWFTGLYRGVWRFASIPDLWNITRAVLIGALVAALSLFLYNRLAGVPRTILVLYPVFLVLMLGAPRLSYRMWRDHGLNTKFEPEAKRVLILGAGRAGEMLVRDMRRESVYKPVGFLDDSPRLKGANVHGIPVFGPIARLRDAVEKNDIDLVMIAMPSATSSQMRRVVALCEQAEVTFRTLPRLQDLVSGQSALKEMREVAIDDLLGRDPVALDWKHVSESLAGKTVLVSGGGGSIGSELCRQIAKLGPSTLVLVEQSEFNLYNVEMELGRAYPNLQLHSCLTDVADKTAVEHVLKTYRPDVIFHAAAYKHVPMLEHQAREAVHNNVLGTRTLATAADKFGCGTFVMVSTDKAVNPANVMGASKRAAEIYCQSLDKKSKTKFITVRFGNVLGSAGSVVPLFRKQIEAGGPVTVTHPEITRFFMTIPEASQLIMQAGAMGTGGEIFVLDMGEPVKVNYLAEQMIRLSGKVPGKDIEITYTGLRPGEKLFEELFHDQECLAETSHEKILLAQCRLADWEQVQEVMGLMETACDSYDEPECKRLLKKLVPEMGATGVSVTDKDNVIPLKVAKVSHES
ncbi:multidrug MFS transporter [Candidatus Tenderia electrophaga]|jgi:FlaA1/EpsC-like NDP-sugar epimerase|uniref:Multidrug MFS transporter n=1 Tax=Candidatus Tenderia electrophaga TaxID=1748243 RepID=A0A0S2TDN6_9GAMM|nr:multidrug MFS transporter [Candidatus Tenderia electrophaga]